MKAKTQHKMRLAAAWLTADEYDQLSARLAGVPVSKWLRAQVQNFIKCRVRRP